jgi:molybdopterin-guanine dinucleotide biosynthesis protein A
VVPREPARRGLGIAPVCCLLPAAAAGDLADYLAAGERRVEPWLLRHARPVLFAGADDAQAFDNFNTLDDLRA